MTSDYSIIIIRGNYSCNLIECYYTIKPTKIQSTNKIAEHNDFTRT